MQRVTFEEFLKSISFGELAAGAIMDLAGIVYDSPGKYMSTLGLGEGSWMVHVFERVQEEIRDDCTRNIAPKYRDFDSFNTKLSEEEIHSLCAEATTAMGRRITELYGNEGTHWEMKIMPLDAHGKYMAQFSEDEPEGGFKQLDDFAVRIDRESFLARVRNRLFDYLAETYDYPKDVPEPVAAEESLSDQKI